MSIKPFFPNDLFFKLYKTIPSLQNHPFFKRPVGIYLFEKIVGKGENAGNQHFLLFPLCFLTSP